MRAVPAEAAVLVLVGAAVLLRSSGAWLGRWRRGVPGDPSVLAAHRRRL